MAGCQGNVKTDFFIDNLKKFGLLHQTAVQAFHAPFIYGKYHIYSAVEHAVRAFHNQTQICHSLDMEILLYAAGRRQIRDAIDTMGIRFGEPMVVVAVTDSKILGYDGFVDMDVLTQFLNNNDLHIDKMAIEGDHRALSAFQVTHIELETVDKSMYGELILERVALVDLIT
jgi:KEOPS complex subunit Cgi121